MTIKNGTLIIAVAIIFNSIELGSQSRINTSNSPPRSSRDNSPAPDLPPIQILLYPADPKPGLSSLLRLINNTYVPCRFPETFLVARPPLIFGWDKEGTVAALYKSPNVKAIYDSSSNQQRLISEEDIAVMGEGKPAPPHPTAQEIYIQIKYGIRNQYVHYSPERPQRNNLSPTRTQPQASRRIQF